MAQQHSKSPAAIQKVDPVWAKIRTEAEDVVRREPEIGTFIYSSILHHDTLEAAVVQRVSERLDHADIQAELMRQAYADALEDQPQIGEAFRADITYSRGANGAPRHDELRVNHPLRLDGDRLYCLVGGEGSAVRGGLRWRGCDERAQRRDSIGGRAEVGEDLLDGREIRLGLSIADHQQFHVNCRRRAG